jgi:hypothetical protein
LNDNLTQATLSNLQWPLAGLFHKNLATDLRTNLGFDEWVFELLSFVSLDEMEKYQMCQLALLILVKKQKYISGIGTV